MSCAIWDALRAGATAEEILCAQGAAHESLKPRIQQTIASWQTEGLVGEFKEDARTADPPLPVTGPSPKWSANWQCRLRGKIFAFAVEDAAIAGVLLPPLQHLVVTEAPTPALEIEVRGNADHGWVLIANGRERLRGSSLANLISSVSLALMEAVWAENSLAAIIHAGAVAKGGRVASFPAPSGSGKTTLVAYLAARGYTYLAEDVMPLDADWNVLPWPLPMRIKSGSWPVLLPYYPALLEGPAFRVRGVEARLLLPPADAWDVRPAKLSAFIFPRFLAGSAAEVQRLSPIEAMLSISESEIWPGYDTSDAHIRNLISGIEGTDSYRIQYGSLADAEDMIGDILVSSHA